MSRIKSNVWNFFYKTSETMAACTLCGRNYSRKGRGTTCLRSHLKSKHPAEFLTLTEIDMKIKTEVVHSYIPHIAAQLELDLPEPVPDPLESAEDFVHCDEKLALLLVNYSLDMLKGEEFISFVKALQPRYIIQDRTFYEQLLCQEIHSRMERQLHMKMEQLESYTLSVGSFGKENEGRHLISLSCRGISSDFQVLCYILKCKVFSNVSRLEVSNSIPEFIPEVEFPLNVQKVHCVFRRDCSVLRLKKCVKNAWDSNEPLQQLARKCTEIIGHFENSVKALDFGSPISLEWNFLYRNMSHLFNLKDSLSIYAEELTSSIQIYPDEWLDIDLCLKVLQPFEEIITIWQESSTSASSVIPLVAALRDSLSTDIHNFVSSVTICSFARKLLEELEMNFFHLVTDVKFLLATYLDPRYKQAFFNEQQEQLVMQEILCACNPKSAPPATATQPMVKALIKNESKIDSILNNMLSSPALKSSNASSSHSQMKNLLYLYNSEPRIERNCNPLAWWQSNIKFSPLYSLVRRYLSMPAASGESGKLFESSVQLLRDGISPENAAKMLFIKSNLNVLDYSD